MPLEHVAELLALPLEWSRAQNSVQILWQRFPELLANAVRRQLGAGAYADTDVLGSLLAAAPSSTASELLDELGERTAGLSPPRFIHSPALAALTASGRTWRDAYRISRRSSARSRSALARPCELP